MHHPSVSGRKHGRKVSKVGKILLPPRQEGVRVEGSRRDRLAFPTESSRIAEGRSPTKYSLLPPSLRMSEQFNEVMRLLRDSRQRGGWTVDQKIELVRQRWLADAHGIALDAQIPGRTAASAWPQLKKLRAVIGEELYLFGQTVHSSSDEERIRIVNELEKMQPGAAVSINAVPSRSDDSWRVKVIVGVAQLLQARDDGNLDEKLDAIALATAKRRDAEEAAAFQATAQLRKHRRVSTAAAAKTRVSANTIAYPLRGSRASCKACGGTYRRFYHCLDCPREQPCDVCPGCWPLSYEYLPRQHNHFHTFDYITPRASSPTRIAWKQRKSTPPSSCDCCGRDMATLKAACVDTTAYHQTLPVPAWRKGMCSLLCMTCINGVTRAERNRRISERLAMLCTLDAPPAHVMECDDSESADDAPSDADDTLLPMCSTEVDACMATLEGQSAGMRTSRQREGAAILESLRRMYPDAIDAD